MQSGSDQRALIFDFMLVTIGYRSRRWRAENLARCVELFIPCALSSLPLLSADFSLHAPRRKTRQTRPRRQRFRAVPLLLQPLERPPSHYSRRRRTKPRARLRRLCLRVQPRLPRPRRLRPLVQPQLPRPRRLRLLVQPRLPRLCRLPRPRRLRPQVQPQLPRPRRSTINLRPLRLRQRRPMRARPSRLRKRRTPITSIPKRSSTAAWTV